MISVLMITTKCWCWRRCAMHLLKYSFCRVMCPCTYMHFVAVLLNLWISLFFVVANEIYISWPHWNPYSELFQNTSFCRSLNLYIFAYYDTILCCWTCSNRWYRLFMWHITITIVLLYYTCVRHVQLDVMSCKTSAGCLESRLVTQTCSGQTESLPVWWCCWFMRHSHSHYFIRWSFMRLITGSVLLLAL